jgi:peptide methionine sulfoxide reductase MsrA
VVERIVEVICSHASVLAYAGVRLDQQYLAKNPNGYCGIGGCGVPFKLAELQVGEKA